MPKAILLKFVENAAKSSKTQQGNVSSFYAYDRLGKVIVEKQPGSDSVRTRYRVDGVPIYRISPMGDSVRMEYDVLGRLERRVEPARVYAEVCASSDSTVTVADCTIFTQSYSVAADTSLFAYDDVGNLVRADNKYARIRRSYFPNGALKSDSSRIRTKDSLTSGSVEYYPGVYTATPGYSEEFAAHLYVLNYTYDLNGRRTALQYPVQISSACGSGCGADSYSYDGSGRLSSITDGRGGVYQFKTTPGGLLDTLIYPNAMRDARSFDADGRTTAINHVKYYTVQFDSLGRLAQTDGPQTTVRLAEIPFERNTDTQVSERLRQRNTLR